MHYTVPCDGKADSCCTLQLSKLSRNPRSRQKSIVYGFGPLCIIRRNMDDDDIRSIKYAKSKIRKSGMSFRSPHSPGKLLQSSQVSVWSLYSGFPEHLAE